MAQFNFTRDGITYIANVAADAKNNSIPDSVGNATGTWLMTIKEGTNKVWFKNGFQDKSNIKTIDSNFTKFVYYTSDSEIISESKFSIKWNNEAQYDAWYNVSTLSSSLGDDINKRFVNGILEYLGHVNTETGEGYLFSPITLDPIDLD